MPLIVYMSAMQKNLVIKLSDRCKYYCSFLYCLILYSFLIKINCRKIFHKTAIEAESLHIIDFQPFVEMSSKKTKIFLDLNYKDMMRSRSLQEGSFSCVVDKEGKLLGYKILSDEKFNHNANINTTYLNKKLIHSTIFGSIKFVRV